MRCLQEKAGKSKFAVEGAGVAIAFVHPGVGLGYIIGVTILDVGGVLNDMTKEVDNIFE